MNDQEKSNPWISPGLKSVLNVTLTVLCISILFIVSVWFIQSMGSFLAYFSPVLWPLAIASILAILLKPLVRVMEEKFGLSHGLAIGLLYFLVIGVGAFSLWAVGGEVIQQTKELSGASMGWPEKIENKVKDSLSPSTWEAIAEKFNQFKKDWKNRTHLLSEKVDGLPSGSTEALQGAWSSMGSLFSFFTSLAIVPIYLYYFLSSKRDHLADLAGQLSFLKGDVRGDVLYLIRQFKEILEVFFRGQLIIGLMMGVGYAIGFSLSGLKFGIALGLFFGLLNIVPFLGSVLGVFTVLVVSYLQTGGILESGNWNVLWGCGFTFAVVQVLESYWLSPRVMGDRTGLHPVVIIASVFFWGLAFDGVLGMILGIPLTAFLTVFWRLLRKKYLPNRSS
jgi:predicted PurR-regulated permease PerM